MPLSTILSNTLATTEKYSESPYKALNADIIWTRHVLQSILKTHGSNEGKCLNELKAFMALRWRLVKGTQLDYTGNPSHPANQWLVSICESLIQENDEISASRILMPSLTELAGVSTAMPDEDKIKAGTEGIEEKPPYKPYFKPQRFLFLNADQSRALSIEEFLEYALKDTEIAFRDITMKDKVKCQYSDLTIENLEELRTLTPEIQRVYDALYANHRQKFSTESLGGILRTFIAAVKESSVLSGGQETQANTTALADELLIFYNDIYSKFPHQVKDDLKKSRLFQCLMTLFTGHYEIDVKMTADEKRHIRSGTYATCTQLITTAMNEDLNAPAQNWLFTTNIEGKPIDWGQVPGARIVDKSELQAAVECLDKRTVASPQHALSEELLNTVAAIIQSPQKSQTHIKHLKSALFSQDYKLFGMSSSQKELTRAKIYLNAISILGKLSELNSLKLDTGVNELLTQLILKDSQLDLSQLMILLHIASESEQEMILRRANVVIQTSLVDKANIKRLLNKLKDYKKHEDQDKLFLIFVPFLHGNVRPEDVSSLLEDTKDLSPTVLSILCNVFTSEIEHCGLVSQITMLSSFKSKQKKLADVLKENKFQSLPANQQSLIIKTIIGDVDEADLTQRLITVFELIQDTDLLGDVELISNLEHFCQLNETFGYTESKSAIFYQICLPYLKEEDTDLDDMYKEHFEQLSKKPELMLGIYKHFELILRANFANIMMQVNSDEKIRKLTTFVDLRLFENELINMIGEFNVEQLVNITSTFPIDTRELFLNKVVESDAITDQVILLQLLLEYPDESLPSEILYKKLIENNQPKNLASFVNWLGFFSGFNRDRLIAQAQKLKILPGELEKITDFFPTATLNFVSDTECHTTERGEQEAETITSSPVITAENDDAVRPTINNVFKRPTGEEAMPIEGPLETRPTRDTQPHSPLPAAEEKLRHDAIGNIDNLSSRYAKFERYPLFPYENALAILENYIRPGNDIGFFKFIPNMVLRSMSGHINRNSIHLEAVDEALTRSFRFCGYATVQNLVADIVGRIVDNNQGSADTLGPKSSLYRRLDYLMRKQTTDTTLEDIIHSKLGMESQQRDIPLQGNNNWF